MGAGYIGRKYRTPIYHNAILQ